MSKGSYVSKLNNTSKVNDDNDDDPMSQTLQESINNLTTNGNISIQITENLTLSNLMTNGHSQPFNNNQKKSPYRGISLPPEEPKNMTINLMRRTAKTAKPDSENDVDNGGGNNDKRNKRQS